MPTPTTSRVFVEHGDDGHGGDHRHDLLGLRGRATPLYHEYQESFGLTPFMLTIIFAAYVVSLLAALLTVGSLSDYIGRRPAITTALALNIVAMVMFVKADSAGALIAARTVQGFATGLATATLGATILDTDRSRDRC
jgi:MFS family permease